MNKNIKYLFVFIFVAVWITAVIISYNKGKKIASHSNDASDNDIYMGKQLAPEQEAAGLLGPKPVLFSLDQGVLEPFDYSLKIENMEENLTIVDEKGNRLNPSQSEKIAFDSFALEVLDHDLKEEESLKDAIQFPVEKEAEEEYYKGMTSQGDEGNDKIGSTASFTQVQVFLTNRLEKPSKESGLKQPEHQIYTN